MNALATIYVTSSLKNHQEGDFYRRSDLHLTLQEIGGTPYHRLSFLGIGHSRRKKLGAGNRIERTVLDLFGFKRFWGRMVFRYAGRNICAVNAARSRKFYNLIGKLYDWLYADLIYGYRQAAQYLVDRCIQRGESVLDIGCGTGLLMQMAQQKAGSLVGIDLSLGMLKQARNKLNGFERSHLIAADCRALPLGVTFDKIVSSFMLVILNQDDQKRVVDALASHLSERGALVFLSARDDLSPEWLTRDLWRRICSEAGFNQVEIIDLYDYYRIVIAERIQVEREMEHFPAINCVAPSTSQT